MCRTAAVKLGRWRKVVKTHCCGRMVTRGFCSTCLRQLSKKNNMSYCGGRAYSQSLVPCWSFFPAARVAKERPLSRPRWWNRTRWAGLLVIPLGWLDLVDPFGWMRLPGPCVEPHGESIGYARWCGPKDTKCASDVCLPKMPKIFQSRQYDVVKVGASKFRASLNQAGRPVCNRFQWECIFTTNWCLDVTDNEWQWKIRSICSTGYFLPFYRRTWDRSKVENLKNMSATRVKHNEI